MAEKMKATVPLALAVGVLAFLYIELTANFTFHWVTEGNLGNGLSLPANFHLVVPAGFITWGLFFALGADTKAYRSVSINSVLGSAAALILFIFVAVIKGLPDFWSIALGVGLLAFILITLSGGLDWINVPVVFGTFAATVMWWIATGLDGWAKNGGGIGKSLTALAKPATAGTGAFGGVLSTPYWWVAIDVAATLLLGVLFGVMSVKLAGVVARNPIASRESGAATT